MHAALARAARVMLAAPVQVNASVPLPYRVIAGTAAGLAAEAVAGAGAVAGTGAGAVAGSGAGEGETAEAGEGGSEASDNDKATPVVAYVYEDKSPAAATAAEGEGGRGKGTVVFLENNGLAHVSAELDGAEYRLPPGSSIMLIGGAVVFNASDVLPVPQLRKVSPAGAGHTAGTQPGFEHGVAGTGAGAGEFEGWQMWSEPVRWAEVSDLPSVMSAQPQPQLAITGQGFTLAASSFLSVHDERRAYF